MRKPRGESTTAVLIASKSNVDGGEMRRQVHCAMLPFGGRVSPAGAPVGVKKCAQLHVRSVGVASGSMRVLNVMVTLLAAGTVMSVMLSRCATRSHAMTGVVELPVTIAPHVPSAAGSS